MLNESGGAAISALKMTCVAQVRDFAQAAEPGASSVYAQGLLCSNLCMGCPRSTKVDRMRGAEIFMSEAFETEEA